MKTCSAAGCAAPARAKGLCTTHYQRQVRGKPVDAPTRSGDLTGRVLGVAVTEDLEQLVNSAAAARGETVASIVREALVLWAARKPKKAPRG